MKKIYFLISMLTIGMLAHAQNKDNILRNPSMIPVTFHGETVPLRDYVEDPNAVNEITKTEKPGYHPKDDWILNPKVNPLAKPDGDDPAWQQSYARPRPENGRSLSYNFEGVGNTNVSPADPVVDVGPNHVIQMINGGSGSYFKIWSKTGTVLQNATYLDNYMGFSGGAGDPIVIYDGLADRWLMSEFASSGNVLHVAISTTADPMGSWYTYSYNAQSFPDYPKYSIWNDAYIVTTNESPSAVYALNRTQMLSGSSGTAQRFTIPNFGTIGFQSAAPVNLDGSTAPPSGTPAMVMRMRDDAWSGAATDALEIWEFDIDWNNANNTSLTQVATLNTQAFDTDLCGYTSFSCIDQPGSSTNLDPLREVLMNRVHYRNFGTHESIVCCHATDVNGNDRAGVRWYELRRTNGTSGSWSIYQQGTYSPDAASRWMASIGISASGNIGLAYSVSSSSIYPSLRYTGRKACDPLNSMTEPETTIIAGTSPNNSNRWGDYHGMGTDPSNGETFWFTGAYGTGNAWSTRVAAFDLPNCSPSVMFAVSDENVNEGDGTQANGCLPYQDVVISMSIASAPSQNATITVNVTGGTATQGVDYDLLTTNLTLNSGNLTDDVTIRVYNDDYVEGDETILLGYSLNANNGNATQGSINQSVTVTINDDDQDPLSIQGTQVLLSEDFESGLGTFTTTNPSGDTPWQVGNETQAQSQAYDIPSSNTTNYAYVNDDNCDCNMSAVYLDFPTLDFSNLNSAQVTFDTYFESNTYQNVTETAGLYVSVNQGTYTLVGSLVASVVDGSWVTQQYSLNAYVGQSDVRLRVKYNDGGGWLYGCTVDNVEVTGESSIDIQTAVNTNNGDDAKLGPNGTVYFYDPTTGNVMASIENTSSWDYGCVSLEVDRDGSNPSAVVFNSSATADFLHSKTFSIVPENNNPNGTYNLTLYYKEAEVAAWESATGNSRNSAEIIKVANNHISDVTPANFTSYSIGNAAATVGAFNSDVTFTSSFNTGFSGFGVGILNTTVTSVDEVLTDVNVYPNPNDGSFTISGLEKGTSYHVFNSVGKLIIGEQIVVENQRVRLPNAAPGSYFLVAEKDGKLGKVQFIVTD
ncbi:MAG: T9SS type A sorting domain-containing protein [Flavobacteriales bacterium]|nr:T9SS type A sorting domain-containing protein [Flavobacteriales bacterium]